MPVCKTCNAEQTSRWYAGPTCNKCHCKARRTSEFKRRQAEYDSRSDRVEKRREHFKNWYYKNRNKHLAKKRTEEGRAYMREYQKEYRKQDKVKKYRSAWKKRPENRAKDNERRRRNYEKDPGKFKAMVALRRARVRQATPSWVDLEAILAIYRACPPGLEVDHIVPLKSDIVCGLHVPWNLQYLSKPDNARKRNKSVL